MPPNPYMDNQYPQVNTVIGFTAYPWEHALTTIRLVEPIRMAGLQFIKGNDENGFYPDRVHQADIVVIQRDFPRWQDHYEIVMKFARQQNKPVIFELDDLLLDLPPDHPDRPIHYYTQALLPMLRAIIEADVITASTPALCNYLHELNPNTQLLPNYLVDSLWGTGKLPQEKLSGHPVVVGYVGSNTHQPDLEMILPALEAILKRYGDRIRLRFWVSEPPTALRNHPNVDWLPLYQGSYAEFAAYFLTQECDVFIAPLKDNEFNRSKSAIKFLECSALGVAGIYSRVAPYTSIVEPGYNGFLASDVDEWVNLTCKLIEDPNLRVMMSAQALKTVHDNWLLSTHAYQWRDIYNQALRNSFVNSVKQVASVKPSWKDIVIRLIAQVQEWEQYLEHKNQALELTLSEKDQAISNLTSQAHEGLQIIQFLQNQIQDKDRSLQELHAQLLEQEQLAQSYEKRLDEHYSSFAGRLMRRLWKLHLFLAPPNSYRDKVWQALTRKHQASK